MFLSLSCLAHSNYRLSLGFTNDGFLLLLLLLCQSTNVKLNVIRIYSRNKLLTLIVDETNRPFASTLVTYRKFVTLRYTLARSHAILFAYYIACFVCIALRSCVCCIILRRRSVASTNGASLRKSHRSGAQSKEHSRMPVPTSSRLP